MKNSKVNSRKSRSYSVRHPKYIWVLRIVVPVLFLASVEWTFEVLERVPVKTSEWASSWISNNYLDQDFIKESPITKPLFTEVQKEELLHQKVRKSTVVQPQVSYQEPQQDESTISSTQTLHTLPSVAPVSYSQVNDNSEVESLPMSLALIEYDANSIEDKPKKNYQAHLQIEYAQASDNRKIKHHNTHTGWIASGSVGPQKTNATVSESSGQSYAGVTNIDGIKSQGVGVINNVNGHGFAAMLNLGLQMGRNFELHSGVSFSQQSGSHSALYDSEVQKTQTILTTVVAGGQNRSMETIETEVTYTNYYSDTLQANYKLSSFEIPLILKYNFGKNKLSYFISSGVSTVVGTSYTANFSSNEISDGDLNEVKYGFNTFNLLLGVGLQFQATDRIVFKLSPGYKYGIPISNSSSLQASSSSIGVFSGLNYYFK